MAHQLTGLLPALMILGFAACVSPDANSPKPQNEDTAISTALQPLSDTLTGAWTLVAADGLEVRQVLLDFSQQGYRLNAGCNSMGGQASRLGEDGLKIDPGMSTMMRCPDNYEMLVQARLTGTTRFEVSETRLTLINADGASLIFERPPAPEQLSGTWKVLALNLNGGVVSSVDQPDQTLTFESGNLTGSDGCNRVWGTYTISDETIAVSDLFSTRMACQWPDGHAWDRAYKDALRNARSISWRGSAVELRDEAGALLMRLSQ